MSLLPLYWCRTRTLSTHVVSFIAAASLSRVLAAEAEAIVVCCVCLSRPRARCATPSNEHRLVNN